MRQSSAADGQVLLEYRSRALARLAGPRRPSRGAAGVQVRAGAPLVPARTARMPSRRPRPPTRPGSAARRDSARECCATAVRVTSASAAPGAAARPGPGPRSRPRAAGTPSPGEGARSRRRAARPVSARPVSAGRRGRAAGRRAAQRSPAASADITVPSSHRASGHEPDRGSPRARSRPAGSVSAPGSPGPRSSSPCTGRAGVAPWCESSCTAGEPVGFPAGSAGCGFHDDFAVGELRGCRRCSTSSSMPWSATRPPGPVTLGSRSRNGPLVPAAGPMIFRPRRVLSLRPAPPPPG